MRGLNFPLLASLLFCQALLAEETPELRAVSDLLDAGFQQGQVPIDELQSVYDRSVELMNGSSGTLDYAYSIVLRKNFHGDAGAANLTAAAENDEPVFLAKEEIIRQHIKKGRWSDAIGELVTLSEFIGAMPPGDDPSPEASRSARWSGLAIAFLKDGLERNDVKEAATKVEPTILGNLGGLYGAAFRIGRGDMALKKRRLLAAASEMKAEVLAENAEKIAKAKVDVAEIQKQQAELVKNLEEFKDIAQDDVADLDSKLQALEEQFEASLKAEQAMLLNMAAIRFDIDAISAERARALRNSEDSSAFQRRFLILDQQLLVRQRELFILTNDYGLLLQSRQNIQGVANQLIARRRQLASQFQLNSNSASEESKRLERLQERFEKIEERANEPPELDRKVKARLRKIRDFDSYEKRNVDVERDLLLKMLTSR